MGKRTSQGEPDEPASDPHLLLLPAPGSPVLYRQQQEPRPVLLPQNMKDTEGPPR